MRIALFSDLHGNELALDAVLSDIEKVGVDRIICLGDVATLGPQPVEVIEKLMALDCPHIMGNHDSFMLDADLVRSYTEAPIIVDAVDWCREQLSDRHFAFFKTFLETLPIDLGHGASMFCFHGSPRSNTKDLLATSSNEELDAALEGFDATVMIGGHTHVQMLRQHRGTLLVNVGSLGAPFEAYTAPLPPTIMPWAEYAIVSSDRGAVSVDLRRIPLDKTQLRERVAAVDFPLRGPLLHEYS